MLNMMILIHITILALAFDKKVVPYYSGVRVQDLLTMSCRCAQAIPIVKHTI